MAGPEFQEVPMPEPRVLIVHDERIIADTLAQILAQSGYQARAVYSGEQAVQAASESIPDVLIAYVVMQGMNGVEAALLIRQICLRCRVLLFSGQFTTVDLLSRAGIDSPAFEILAKPVFIGRKTV